MSFFIHLGRFPQSNQLLFLIYLYAPVASCAIVFDVVELVILLLLCVPSLMFFSNLIDLHYLIHYYETVAIPQYDLLLLQIQAFWPVPLSFVLLL